MLDFANLRDQFLQFRSQVTNDPDFMRLHLYAAPASHFPALINSITAAKPQAEKPAYLEFIDGRIKELDGICHSFKLASEQILADAFN